MSSETKFANPLVQKGKAAMPGILVALLVAIAAQFLSDHYGAPAMLMALLLGIALHFLAEDGRCVEGIQLAVSSVLRIGVALLGARVSFELLSQLGLKPVLLVALGILSTMIFGLIAARMLGRGWRLAILTGGSVAICGASAAIAIAAVLPKNSHSERNLIFTILSVTVLSTLAMIAYPPLAALFGLDAIATGIFLGGTIHDVAQVVGAGFSVSQETGEVATIVKLLRVSMLAPIVLLLSLSVRKWHESEETSEKRPPLIPTFVLGFLVLAAINSFGLIPPSVQSLTNDVSRWALLIAISAVGMKTSLRAIFNVGGQAIALIVLETVFIAAFIVGGLMLLK